MDLQLLVEFSDYDECWVYSFFFSWNLWVRIQIAAGLTFVLCLQWQINCLIFNNRSWHVIHQPRFSFIKKKKHHTFTIIFTNNILQSWNRNDMLGLNRRDWALILLTRHTDTHHVLRCTHTNTPATRITSPLWDGGNIWSDEYTTRRLQVSVTILISTKPVGGGRELMSLCVVPEKWEGTGDLGLIACRLQDDIQCLKHAQTFPHLCLDICRNRQAQPLEIVCATEMFDLKESLIMGWPGCLGSRDEWFSPGEVVQGIGKVLFERESGSREVRVT